MQDGQGVGGVGGVGGTRWLFSVTLGSREWSRALHLHMKGTCMEMGTDGSTDDGYEGDVSK